MVSKAYLWAYSHASYLGLRHALGSLLFDGGKGGISTLYPHYTLSAAKSLSTL